ncbi:DNA-binding response regulator [Algimonas ampicilliniresistens]|jgi:two-component system response regulator FixJ|uniref:DNA-binding response regulator n=1 Tax=Algimonas ampicilliniresistens TaxID=1298735 RepID=A0ABQ5V6S4_9PROT|nr:response regulator [Algimonas ampicilliniresistens]GLQ22370.1 DNA-binding response regulator [Algimonas ampicilliniresistens]
MKPTIHIIDDDEQVRESLGLLLETVGHDVLTYVSGDAHVDAAPDLTHAVLILDVRMPGRDGLETLLHVRTRSKNVPVIMISGHGDVPLAVKAMQAGANDFVEKPFVANRILSAIDRLGEPVDMAPDALAALTPRELEVAKALADGKPNKVVAHELGVSVRTVETHRARVMSKLGIRSLAELVRLILLP